MDIASNKPRIRWSKFWKRFICYNEKEKGVYYGFGLTIPSAYQDWLKKQIRNNLKENFK